MLCRAYEYAKKNKLGKGPIAETAKMFQLTRQTVSKIVKRGPKTPQKRGSKQKLFQKVDSFTCDVVRREVYIFFRRANHQP